MSRTGSRTALISTRPLSLPSASAFLQSVHTKIGKSLFLNPILMVLITILYSIPPKPASAVSSCCSSLGCLSKNGPLMNTTGRFVHEEIKTILTQSLDTAGSKIFIKPNSNSIAGWRTNFNEAGKLFLPVNTLFDTNGFFVL